MQKLMEPEMNFTTMSEKIVNCHICKKEFLAIVDTMDCDDQMFCSADCIEKFNS